MKPPRTLGMEWTESAIRRHLEITGKVLAGNLTLGATTSNADPDKNLGAYKATGTTPVTPNTAFTVKHSLTHVPIGFSVLRANAAAHIYDSGTAWTAATFAIQGTISLKCDVASVAFTLIIW
jgi:hypothetical protein